MDLIEHAWHLIIGVGGGALVVSIGVTVVCSIIGMTLEATGWLGW